MRQPVLGAAGLKALSSLNFTPNPSKVDYQDGLNARTLAIAHPIISIQNFP
jgi:hypothetical protein